ncbi:MAG: hypothetical protein JXQ29_04005 [Planctomycetes bacterium]|nr:hypothetical protein [Planctomycetota bacterium]
MAVASRIIAQERRGAVYYQAIAALDPIDRETVLLRPIHQASNDPAASLMQISPKAAATRTSRAEEPLRETLRRCGGKELLDG